MRLALLAVVWLSFGVMRGWSAAASEASPEYQKQNWQVEDGLPENEVRAVVQQPNGMLLVATSAGLASFDGQRFEAFAIPGEPELSREAMNALLYGRDGDLWVGTNGSGVLHVTAAGTIRISEAARHENERVRRMALDSSGVLWIATQNGIERYQDGVLEDVADAGMVEGSQTSPFAEDGAKGMFFVTSEGLFHWRAGRAHAMRVEGTPTALYRDAAGQITVGVGDRLLRLTPAREATGEWQTQELPGRFGSAVRVMLRGPDGCLWIGTERDGLWRQSAAGTGHWTTRDGLADDAVRTLFVDDERNLWVGMLARGLSRWRRASLAPYRGPESTAIEYATTPFADSRGDLWLGTLDRGLFRMKEGVVRRVRLPGESANSRIRAIAEDRAHQVWIGTWFDGLYRTDGRSFVNYPLGLRSPRNAISEIACDRAGGLWVGTYRGIMYYGDGVPEPGRERVFLAGRRITAMLEDGDGSMLVGTTSGLFRVREGEVVEIRGLANGHVLALTRDSTQTVWVSTRAGGLSEVSGNRTQELRETGGVTTGPINTMIEDARGQLWLGTSRGIVRVTVRELHAVAAEKLKELPAVLLGRSDGMPSSDCSGSTGTLATRAADGSLWFTTTAGYVHTAQTVEDAGAVRPVAQIRGWALGNDAESSKVQPGSSLVLEAGEPDVLFFFWAKLLSDPAKVQYRYRLAGYDRDWTLTKARVARYRRLSPGSYRFEVQARNSGDGWTSPVAWMPVRQSPHFYQAWSFSLLLAVLLLLGAWWYVRRRIRQEKGSLGMVLEERSRIARECHDTLMAGFAAVSWQLEATAKLFRDSGSASTPAAESCELARSMVAVCQAEARRIIWDLRDTEEVTSSLSHALGRMLSVNHINERAETTLAVDGEEIPLPPGCVHHLTCIGQEAVTNALKHAGPTRVEITLRYDAEMLHLAIRDDGCGFRTAERGEAERGHFGIPVMEERARKLGGTLRLETTMGFGTEVLVTVPFEALEKPVGVEQNVLRWIGI